MEQVALKECCIPELHVGVRRRGERDIQCVVATRPDHEGGTVPATDIEHVVAGAAIELGHLDPIKGEGAQGIARSGPVGQGRGRGPGGNQVQNANVPG